MRAINPTTEDLIAVYEDDRPADIDRKIARAASAAGSWRTTPLLDRTLLMRGLGRLLREQRESCAQLVTLEMGKPITDSRAEIEKAIWVCEYYADHGEGFLHHEHVVTGAARSFVRYDPLGVVLAVMPWNFPFWLLFRAAVPILLAGNVVMLKHASNVPGCALRIEELFAQAGFPTGVFTTLLIGSDRVAEVIHDPRVAGVTLTGSVGAGSEIGRQAGAAVKKAVLELGGSDPLIVLADADVERAAHAAVASRMKNCGQSCNSAKRIIVESPVYARFLDAFLERLRALRIGDPLRDATEIGPLARDDVRETLHRQVSASVEAGATLLAGGHVPEGRGYFYPPTVLTNVRESMPVFREETFGPVAPIIEAADADDALRLANATEYGLGASLWTSIERGEQLAARIEAGFVAINATVSSDPRLPFGGVKRSGYGRELSRQGMLEFTNVKTVLAQR